MNRKVYFEQDGTIDGRIIAEELTKRGAVNLYDLTCSTIGKLCLKENPPFKWWDGAKIIDLYQEIGKRYKIRLK